MLLRLRLLTGTVVSSLLLLVMLCLGSQNLNQREQLQLGFGQSAPLPTGFVVGIALVCGVFSGGSVAALLRLAWAGLPWLPRRQLRGHCAFA